MGLALVAVALVLGGRRTGRTRYRPDPWALPECLVVASGATAAVMTFWQVRVDATTLVLSSPLDVPPVPPLACLGILVALLPAVLSPPLPLPTHDAGATA